jgi:hypothetical protein
MPGKFRRIAVLGVTSLGTWAVVPAPAPAEPVAKAASAAQSKGPDGVRGQPRVEQPQR